jgi:hypothetical protein
MHDEVDWKEVKIGQLKEHPKLSEIIVDGDKKVVVVLG